jgi:prophage antirepressor-like protein
MQEVKTFDFYGSEIRTVTDEYGESWFIARDVAILLGYKDPKDAISTHTKYGVKRRLPSVGGEQDTIIIPERDLYRLVLRSKMPKAEEFEEWVVAKVLPSIRKTGSYGIENLSSKELEIALLNAKRRESQISVKREIDSNLPFPLCIRDAADVFGIRQMIFTKFLHKNAWIYRDKRGYWAPHVEKVRLGFLTYSLNYSQFVLL